MLGLSDFNAQAETVMFNLLNHQLVYAAQNKCREERPDGSVSHCDDISEGVNLYSQIRSAIQKQQR